MEEELKILILEDVELDAELMEYEMRHEGLKFSAKRVDTEHDFTNALEELKPDLILADYSLPQFDGVSALKIAKKICPEIPFIFVSGKMGEEFAVEVLKEGATDYVLKNNLSKLVPAVQRALKEFKELRELKITEETLHKRDEQLRLITDNMLDMVAQIDDQGVFQYFSPSIKKVLGYEPDEVLNRSYLEILGTIHPEDSEKIKLAFEKIMNTSLPNIVEYRCKHADGHYMWLESMVSPLFNNSKQINGAILVIRDISDRKKAEKKLQEYHQQLESMVEKRTAELEAINRELEYFSFSVSHDLRAPLRRIDGFSQALLEDYEEKLGSEGKYYLERIRVVIQNMGQLIDDMLNLARLTRGEIHHSEVDLSLMAHKISRDLQNTQPEREVEFIIADGLKVNGDFRLLRVMLENFFDNAWKFTSKNPHAKIEFGVTDHEGKKVYFVRDNGTGFDMQNVNKLFKPFQRLHTSDEFPGSGIGLATVQRIVHRHGGQTWAESEDGKGATFYFII